MRSVGYLFNTDRETLFVYDHMKLYTCISEIVGVLFLWGRVYLGLLLFCGVTKKCTVITNRKWKLGVCITC